MTESPSKRQFTEILTRPDPAVDLAEASLLIACAEYPDLDVAHYLGLLDAMGADVGARLQELDSLDELGDGMALQYAKTSSELKDLDYASAVSDLTRQQLMLEAAQKSFTRIAGMSLFDFF